ncbi:MAG: cysteine synthase family protein [Bacteroidia bacterium]|nr:cysteine synthase family protein [Bacteroidia bacterium]
MAKKLAAAKSKNRYESIDELIGNTPLVKLQSISEEIGCDVWAKLEMYNPGLSAKDRIALHIINTAEENGEITAGATLIEATSGNTGYSIAMLAAVRGYKCILTVTDKISKEKYDMLKALGAEIHVCPKDADPESPNSYYETAKRLANEIPNSFYLNQNYSTLNMEAHFKSTGKEIWNQTEGKITHLVGSTGTGGTLCGSGMYLKQKNPKVQVFGVDSYGSVLMKYWETGVYDKNEIKPYTIEGLGKNIIPANVLFEHIDNYTKVHDKDAALMTRRIAKEEGLLIGYSSGANISALYNYQDKLNKDDVVVVIISDHGSRYLGKIFNDQWMKERDFL